MKNEQKTSRIIKKLSYWISLKQIRLMCSMSNLSSELAVNILCAWQLGVEETTRHEECWETSHSNALSIPWHLYM